MGDSPGGKPPGRDWRFGLTIGMSIGAGIAISRGVTSGLETSLGHWGAFLLGVVAASVGGGLAALLAHRLLRRDR